VLFKDVIAASTSSYEENKTNPKQPKLISVTAFIDVKNQKQREFAKKVNKTCFEKQCETIKTFPEKYKFSFI
jgi:hypothetical protein